MGWRALVTNSPKKRLCLAASVLSYRSGWCLERDFHLLKDNPLGIRPLYVKSDAQIGGLVRLMTLALRMLIRHSQIFGGSSREIRPVFRWCPENIARLA